MKPPKGLRLFDRAEGICYNLKLDLADNYGFDARYPENCGAIVLGGEATVLDADQLDKLAERCKRFSTYLRSLPKTQTKKPKWEDL